MNSVRLIRDVRASLAAITAARYFETERGFQGELLVQLAKRVTLSGQTIIEQEYQKRANAHGLTCRPDIILHEPFDPSRHQDRTEGNLAVIELKLRATYDEAAADYQSIAEMIRVLRYPLGLFINIGSDDTFAALASGDVQGKVMSLAVFQRDGKTEVVG